MNEEIVNKAEEALREIAKRSDTSVRQIQQLVIQLFHNESKFQESVNSLRQEEVQAINLKLLAVQTDNEILHAKILQAKLKRMLWLLKKLGIIKNPKA